jgi:hypothetical protein
MSFSDPLSVTIAGTTTPLPRTSVEEDGSEYTSADGLIVVSASHQYGKRTRRQLRIDTSKLTADPFKPSAGWLHGYRGPRSVHGLQDPVHCDFGRHDHEALGWRVVMTPYSKGTRSCRYQAM